MLYFDDIVLHARERPHGQARFAETISSMYYALLTDFKLQCLIANTTDAPIVVRELTQLDYWKSNYNPFSAMEVLAFIYNEFVIELLIWLLE